MNNSQGKIKEKKKTLSKAINSLHNLVFQSHGNCADIRKLQRRKRITCGNLSNQATTQEQAEQRAGFFLTFLPFTKKTSSSPVSFGAILHTFQKSLKSGRRSPFQEQPCTKRAPAIGQATRACLKNV